MDDYSAGNEKKKSEINVFKIETKLNMHLCSQVCYCLSLCGCGCVCLCFSLAMYMHTYMHRYIDKWIARACSYTHHMATGCAVLPRATHSHPVESKESNRVDGRRGGVMGGGGRDGGGGRVRRWGGWRGRAATTGGRRA